MSELTVYSDNDPDTVKFHTVDDGQISRELTLLRVEFRRLSPSGRITAEADDERVKMAYAKDIDDIKKQGRYPDSDIIRSGRIPQEKIPYLREQFGREHTHNADEVRIMIGGAGAFYLHGRGDVYRVICEEGDLIRIPEGKRHWFGMGSNPKFSAIRLFGNTDGWAADYTGDNIADRFPAYENK